MRNLVVSIILFVLGLAVFIWMNKDKKNFRFNIDEVHHAYYGWLVVWILPFHHRLIPLWVYIPILFVGFLLLFDDFGQHRRQSYDPDYQSPIHRLLRFFEFIW